MVSDVHYDAAANLYTAALRLRDDGPATGRKLAVVFTGLPSGVQLQNPSGTDASGNPYISFASAIADGGLGMGSLSDPIQVTFADPNQERFALVPQILSGGPDNGPNFTPVGPLSVMPGGLLKVALQASDPDGDPVHFSLKSADPLPTGNLQSDGTLVFTPTPDELGTYHLTLVASDGAQQATQNVTLTVVADPVTTTRLSGVVQNAAGQPLAGVPVDVLATSASATTASDGSFVLDMGSDTVPAEVILEVHGDQLGGPTVYPFVTAFQSVLFGHAVYQGVNNVIGRPLILTPVDTADEVTIDGSAATTVTTPAIPGASLSIPAGARILNGHLYNGPLGLTEVSVDTTPVPLPEGVHPDRAIMIQPAGDFRSPVTLTLPNQAGWPRGTGLDLWALSPSLGTLQVVAEGFVTDDGTQLKSIDLTGDGVLYFFAPSAPKVPSPATDPLNPLPGLPGSAESASFGSDVDLYSGAVHTGHDLVSYQSQGVVRGLHLEYNSLWADPRPIIHFGFPIVPPSTADDRLAAQLALVPGRQLLLSGSGTGTVTTGAGGAAGELGLPSGENYWLLPAGDGPVAAALQADLTAQPSGVYDFELSAGLVRYLPGTGRFVGTLGSASMPVVSVNAAGSPFGSGWSLAGLQQVVENADGSVLLIDGAGTTLLFQPPTTTGGPYVSPAGDFSTLVKLPNGTFQRTLKDQTVYSFNDQGQLALVQDRNGNQTQYLYDSSGRLTTIVDPAGLRTTFAYTGNLVTTITDPAQRTTVLQYDAAGNLVAVIDPDQSMQQWQYDGNHLLTAEIDKRGNRDQDFYDFAGRAMSSSRADGSTVQVAPAEVQGLFPADQTVDPLSPTLPTVMAPADAVVKFADPDGHVTTQTLDQRGQKLSTSDEIGSLGSVTRDANGFIVQSTSGLGNQTTYTYDKKGNLTTTQDALAGPFRPQIDHTFGFTAYGENLLAGPAIGDVNGDGAPDIVVAVGQTGSEVLFNSKDAAGRPTGMFTAGPFFQAGQTVDSLALGDVNGDGKLDYLTVGPQGVGVSLGKGDGSFGDPDFYPMGTQPSALVAADFTGDGRADVATADSVDSAVSVRLANPDGTLGEVATYDVGGPQSALAVADINGDGVPDLVTINKAGTSLTILLGNRLPATGKGDGTFTAQAPIPITSTPYSGIAFGDLNEDGRLDIVVAGDVLLNDGDGTFTVVAHPEISGDVAIADVDGDKHLDVIVPTSFSAPTSGLNILRGKGDGTFGQTLFEPLQVMGQYGASIVPLVADLKRDGNPDLVVAISPYIGALDVAVLLNNNLRTAGSGPVGQRSTTYDPTFNEPTSETDELGRQKLLQIDPANGNVLTATVVVGDGTHNLVTHYTYYADGQVKTITDPLGRVTAFAYDADGRLQTQTAAQGTPDQAITTYEYDAAGNLSAVIDPDSHRTEYHYDSMNRLTLVHDALGHDTTLTYDVSGNVLTATDARGNVTTNAYDSFSRLIQTTGPDPDGPGPLSAPVTTYTYDPAGNLIRMVDPLQHATAYAYDARKRLIAVTDALAGITSYEYDLDNNRTAVTDPDGNRTQLTYDLRDRLVSETDPLSHVITFQFDPVNHLVSTTDRDGRTITYTFNELDQPLTETWTGANNSTYNVIRYVYDDDGNPLTVADSFSTRTYTYTNRNEVATVDNGGTPNLPHVVLAYTYDPAGNAVTVADTVNGAADMTNTYSSDALNRVTEITQIGSSVHDKRVDVTYNEVGQLATIDRFADQAGTQEVVSSAYMYDGLNRLTGLAYSHGGTPVAAYQYTFDAASLLTQAVDNDGTSDYSYDNLGQLVGADHHSAANPAESYTYDASGNRVTSGTQANTDQIGTDNRLTSDGTYNYTYDNEGNLIQRIEIATNKVRVFQWDERNRLIAVIDKDSSGNVTQQVLFTYDAVNERIATEIKQGGSDVASYFISDRGNALLDFVDDDGPAGPDAPVLAMRYLTGPAADQVFAQEDASGRVSWLLADSLGTVRDLVDNNGAVANHITYDSYGNIIAQTHPASTTRFLYAGRELDASTGLYYDRSRYYDPELGRFLSEDPTRFLGGTNLYRYVHNNPVSRRDPFGTQDDNPDGQPVPTDDQPDQQSQSTENQPQQTPPSTPDQTQKGQQAQQAQQAQPQMSPASAFLLISSLVGSGFLAGVAATYQYFQSLAGGAAAGVGTAAADAAAGANAAALAPGAGAAATEASAGAFTPLVAPNIPTPVSTPSTSVSTVITDVVAMFSDTLSSFIIIPGASLIEYDLNQSSGNSSSRNAVY
jgi:RHS repeat-associated protein